MKLTKSQIKELIRHSIRELTSEREDVTESKGRRFTVKEVRMWMKKLEENRYKKVYNSDARRVAWMVNNEGVELSEMPVSMSKKWTKAQYGRERYLATEFLKSKLEQMTEEKLTEKQSAAVQRMAKQGMWVVTDGGRETIKVVKNERAAKMLVKKLKKDKSNRYNNPEAKAIKLEGKLTSEQKLRKSIREIIKEQLNEKTFGSQAQYMAYRKKHNLKPGSKHKVAGKTVTVRDVKKISKSAAKKADKFAAAQNAKLDAAEKAIKKKKGKIKEAYRSQSIFFDKKDKSKLEKLLKKNKGKFPFNPSGESVVNWSLNDKGSKGLEWGGIPKAKYNKAVEFFMKNKLNPRG